MKKWNWKAAVFFVLALSAVCVAVVLKETSDRSVEDDVDLLQLRDADALKESYQGVILELADGEIWEDISVLRMRIENQSDAYIAYEYEITIDRKINGGWKFWGTAGNSSEVAYGISPQEEEILEFKLDSEELSDADYIENANGVAVQAEGHNDDFSGKRIAIRFPKGEYRIRKLLEVYGENGEYTEHEAVKEFSVPGRFQSASRSVYFCLKMKRSLFDKMA